jgi:hypothetical protein
MSNHTFGSCCVDLGEAMTGPPNSFFRVEENGVLYLTIGYMPTDQGPAWFDQAVLFCPFCGARLQDKAKIRETAGTPIN